MHKLCSRAASFPARALAVCVVALVALGQLNALGHTWLVQHTVCAEHGDVHHEVSAGPPSSSATPAPAVQVTVTAGGASAGADHEHCDGWVRLPQPLAPPEPRLSAELGSQSQSMPRAPARAEHALSIPLLAVAPKLPPPTARSWA
ncbi:MAG: hypothetical protein KF718_17855 [Polyangiaceae bacterium]|nr:hypothetical protein [Polyangiaceae bacterium]